MDHASEGDVDRKAAETLVWVAEGIAAGKDREEFKLTIKELPKPWCAVGLYALSGNRGPEFLSALRLEVRDHPERERMLQPLEIEIQRAKRSGPEGDASGTYGLREWPTLDPKALYGLAGDYVRLVEPHTEADPVALLLQMLIAGGNVIGSGPHFQVEGDQHSMNLFAILVGATSKGRKGTSWGHIRRLFKGADPDWAGSRIESGLSSGEGLIWAVRDPIEKQEPIREKKIITRYQSVIVDPGITDKRLLVMESEFASVLRIFERDGNTLSPIIREAWDSGNLTSLTKNSLARATGAHISILGHITMPELRRYLTQTEAGNGFANRFLWACVRRSKQLPDGGNLASEDFAPMLQTLQRAIGHARAMGEIRRDDDARALWHEIYGSLSEGAPGLFGAVTSRAEAQVARLQCAYALLEQSAVVRREHLEAALALWKYAEDSARFIFGDAIGDPVADEILRALRSAPKGMSRTQISKLFQRNRESSQISAALQSLQAQGLAWCLKEETGGRPVERWLAGTPRKEGS